MQRHLWVKRTVLLEVIACLLGTGVALAQQNGSSTALAETRVTTPAGTYSDIKPRELNAALAEEPEPFALINVHIPYEGEIRGTDAFIPFDVIADRAGALPADRDAPIVLYCMSGRMSEIAATTLVELGYTNVKNLRGGMVAWRNAGLSLVRRQRATEP